MLSNISKSELAELTRKMRAAASLPKESLTQKRKALVVITHNLIDSDEQTTSRLVFKRKRKVTTPPTENSHSGDRAPHQEVKIIQECKSESSKAKSLWDHDFDVSAHGEAFFLPSEDKARLMVHDEDHLRHDTLKLFGKAFAMVCLFDAKEKDQMSVEDQRIKENMELHKEVERLQAEINRLDDLHQNAKRLEAEKTQVASSLAEERSKLLSKV